MRMTENNEVCLSLYLLNLLLLLVVLQRLCWIRNVENGFYLYLCVGVGGGWGLELMAKTTHWWVNIEPAG